MADDKDDLLDPDEIEALLSAAGQMQPGPQDPGRTAGAQKTPSPFSPDTMSQQQLDALFEQGPGSSRGGAGFSSAGRNPEDLLRRAEASLAAAVAPDFPSRHVASQLPGATPFEFEQFSAVSEIPGQAELTALQEVELDLRIELGRTELLIEEVLKLREGSVVPLDKLAGDPVDILVNGRLIARGEVLVLNDNFCVRVAEILAPAYP